MGDNVCYLKSGSSEMNQSTVKKIFNHEKESN